MSLKTERLVLRAITSETLRAERAGNGVLQAVLHARVTAEWPAEHWEPHVLDLLEKQLAQHPETLGWQRYVLLPQADGDVLVGTVCAFPKGSGEAEVGYATLPEFQRRGYATEALRGLIAWLFAEQDVLNVWAQTFPHLPESIKVMERCGLMPDGAGEEPGTVRYCRRR